MQELGRMIKKLCSKLFSRIVITGVLILIQAAWFWSLFTSLSSYAHWLNPLMIVLSVIMCAVLIRQDSTAPEFKISWMVLFMIMPVQGGLLYLLWGDKRPAFRLRKKLDWAYDRIRPLRRTDPAAQALLFLKSTVRPWLSVIRPSSRTCSRMLNTSGWAFSTSSNSTTL